MYDEAAIKETVESLNRLGYPELIVRSDNEPVMLTLRDAVIRELQERFGVQAIAQAPPKYDSASAGMLENAIKHVKQKVRDAVIRELQERFGVHAIAQAPPKYDSASAGMVENDIKQVNQKVRTLVIATSELHGVVMDPEHVALAVCAFCWSDHLKFCERRRWAHCISTCSPASHPRAMTAAWGEKILYLEASKKIQIPEKFWDGIFLGVKEGSEEFIMGTLAACVVCRTVKRRPREDAADPVFFAGPMSVHSWIYWL